jgi:hypothetical protein
MDSFCASGFVASQFGFVSEEIRICTSRIRIRKTNLSTVLKDLFCGFVSYYSVQKICFVDSIRDTFWQIQQILMSPDKSLLHRRTLDGSLGFVNPYCVQNICFVDSFCTTVFKRFVSWIRFVLRCSKDLFLGFALYYRVQKIYFVDLFCKKKNVKNTRFVLFWKDSCTIPASLGMTLCQKWQKNTLLKL